MPEEHWLPTTGDAHWCGTTAWHHDNCHSLETGRDKVCQEVQSLECCVFLGCGNRFRSSAFHGESGFGSKDMQGLKAASMSCGIPGPRPHPDHTHLVVKDKTLCTGSGPGNSLLRNCPRSPLYTHLDWGLGSSCSRSEWRAVPRVAIILFQKTRTGGSRIKLARM